MLLFLIVASHTSSEGSAIERKNMGCCNPKINPLVCADLVLVQ